MGYRSEVVIGVNETLVEKFEEILNKHDLLLAFDLEHTKDSINIYRGEYLKWYDSYKDVQDINSFIKEHTEDKCFMLCLGEDGQTHDEKGEYWNYCGVRMEIEFY